MKGNTANKVTQNAPVNHFKESNITCFVIEEKVLWIFFTVPLFYVFYLFISSTSASKNKSKRRAAV